MRRWGRRRPTRRRRGFCSARASQCSWRPTRLTTNAVEADAAELWSLGLGEPYPVSAMHGRGVADLLDKVIDALPAVSEMASGGGGPRRVALVGKPNVGKSSLLNRLAGDERSVVHDVAGTTVDPVDSLIEMDGKIWRFVDTAGLRRKVGAGQRARVLRVGAHARRHRCRRGGHRADRRIAAADRTGPAGAVDGDRGGPGVGAGVQQVGPGRRGSPLPAGPGDRARAGAVAVGAAGQHLGQDGPGGAETGARAGDVACSRGTPGCRRGG